MIRKAILMLGMLAVTAAGYAQSKQPCATDAFYKEQKALFPGIAEQEKKLKADIDQYLKGRMNNPYAKTTAGEEDLPWPLDTRQLHIPVVVHIIYDYANPNSIAVTDDEVFGMMKRLNEYYNAGNADLAYIIPPFVPYIGNTHISFHLATKDPAGKPTRGIVRSHSYLSNGGDESAKIGAWAPDQYLNIYLENYIGRGTSKGIVLAYATFPTSFSDNPYSQGVISRGDQSLAGIPGGQQSTIAHEIGHFLTLYHPWNSNGQDVEGTKGMPLVCGDDEVDDTQPTIGHFSCSNVKLYDTFCATGYFKNYDNQTAYHRFMDSSAAGTHKDYPDTTNTQNIMDYSSCTSNMFTKEQAARMRASLRSSVGSRAHLVDSSNLRQTGVMDAAGNFVPTPNLPPIADFSVNRNFICADGNTSVTITNRSYNATIVGNTWSISNGASNGNATSSNVNTNFSTPGWVNISLTADGSNNAGSNTLIRKDLVYAADKVGKSTYGYFQEFNSGGDLDMYPIFNHFGTSRKWEVVNTSGYYDKTSIRYSNYDTRAFASIDNADQSPGGDYADFYTPAFDLNGFGPVCNVSFYSAGAFRTNKPSEMNDTLFVAASVDCGTTWRTMGTLTKGQIGNNGYRNDNFVANYPSEWREQSIPVDPTTGRSDHTFFRFRFKTGTDVPSYYGGAFGSGNNFFLDRINISNAPLGVKNGIIVNLGMSVVPNPTNGAATVSLTGGDNSLADLFVTDVTGKLVYSSSIARTATTTKVEIPAAAIAVKGMYLVKVVTNGATETQKLVVY